MSIKHIQKTFCYCCKCREHLPISEVEIFTNIFLTVDNKFMESLGWKIFFLNNTERYICPKHKVEIMAKVIIDGERYKDD